jgi:hypothetical protein
MKEINPSAQALPDAFYSPAVPVMILIDTIYTEVTDKVSEDICRECPVVEFIRLIRHNIKDASHEHVMSELGVEFSGRKCPCTR